MYPHLDAYLQKHPQRQFYLTPYECGWLFGERARTWATEPAGGEWAATTCPGESACVVLERIARRCSDALCCTHVCSALARSGDSALLKMLQATGVGFTIQFDRSAVAFRATARLLDEASGKEACVVWVHRAHVWEAFVAVASRFAAQLVLDHEEMYPR